MHEFEISPPTDCKVFESICFDLWRIDKDFQNVQLNGSLGQKQNGVDIFARRRLDRAWVGIQCKVKSTSSKLSEKEIIVEIEKAASFNPTLISYIFCTTQKRHSKTQEIFRNLADHYASKMHIEFLFWEEICEKLRAPKSASVYEKYYGEFFVNDEKKGLAIGRILDLELTKRGHPGSHYELMIGYIPKHKSHNKLSAKYFSESYFVVNFNERKMETIPLPCYETDVENAFSNRVDAALFAEWVNKIKDLKKYIRSDPGE